MAAATAYVGLGANLGDTRGVLRAAATALANWPGVLSAQGSPLYRTAPVLAIGPEFVNAVLRIETTLGAFELLAVLQQLEQRHGRERPFPNAPRTLDLDLLLYGEAVINSPSLTLPHPRLHQRAFVLQPLLALNPALQAPGLGVLSAYLAGVQDQSIEALGDALRV